MICKTNTLLLRALNDYDIEVNPTINGIASKKMLYDIVETYYHSKPEYLRLSPIEQKQFIIEHIPEYIRTHQHRLIKKFEQRMFEIRKDIRGIMYPKEDYETSSIKLTYELSSLNGHLANGSRSITNWISTTSNPGCITRYSQNQKHPQIAIIKPFIVGFVDHISRTCAIDVSTKESLEESKVLFKKIKPKDLEGYLLENDNDGFRRDIVERTNESFRGFNYSQASKEICYYGYIPPIAIKGVIEQLQYELICLQLYNVRIFNENHQVQKEELLRLKSILRQMILARKDPYLLRVYDELYGQNKNISYTNFPVIEYPRVQANKVKILKLARNIPSNLIKKGE